MSKQENGNGSSTIRACLRALAISLVIFALAGVFGAKLAPARHVSVPGIVVMLLGLAMATLSPLIAGKLPEQRREQATVWLKLGGVLVCAVGAMIVFYT